MIEVFLNKALSLLSGFFWFIIILMANIEFLILYVLSQIWCYYYAWLLVMAYAVYVGIRNYRSFTNFKTDLAAYIETHITAPEPVTDTYSDQALTICARYRNGSTMQKIRHDLGLTHPNQVRRQLLQGIGFLLRFYDEHKQEDVKT